MKYPKMQPGQPAFSTFETAKICGLHPRSFKTLMFQGLITSGTKVQWGESYRTIFGTNALHKIGVFLQLKKFLRNDVAAIMAQNIFAEDFDNLLVLTDENFNQPVLIPSNQAESLKRITEFETALVINLPKVKSFIDAAIDDYFKN
ncbi:MAG: hypothetical protein C4518_08650 [Desulfobacteraceae bacterium]|nr:MAG: hypothetical protein C4518_08650 [Desulfobacteraceae bacterium]